VGYALGAADPPLEAAAIHSVASTSQFAGFSAGGFGLLELPVAMVAISGAVVSCAPVIRSIRYTHEVAVPPDTVGALSPAWYRRYQTSKVPLLLLSVLSLVQPLGLLVDSAFKRATKRISRSPVATPEGNDVLIDVTPNAEAPDDVDATTG
jgi:hypothetical protein